MNISPQPPTTFYINIAKISLYLLDLSHPVGKIKAVFFINNGFSPSRPDILAQALFGHASSNTPKSTSAPGGIKYVFEGMMPMPNGRSLNIRSVWIVRTGTTVGEFVTAYRI